MTSMKNEQEVMDDKMFLPSGPHQETTPDLPSLSDETAAEETEEHPHVVEGTLIESTLLSGDVSSGRALRRLRPGYGRALHQGLLGMWMVLTLLLVFVLAEDRMPGLLGPLASLLPGLTPSAT